MRVGLFVAALGVALAVGVPSAHAECTTPELPVLGCVAPGPTAEPSPLPSPSPSAVATAVPAPTVEAVAAPAAAVRTLEAAPAPDSVAVLALPAGIVAEAPVAAPEVQPALAPLPPVLPALPVPANPVAVTAAVSPLSGTLAASFALVIFGLLLVPLLLGFLAGLRSSSTGGTVNATRTRLWIGLSVIGLAAVIGGFGWYQISGEPLLNRQIPFLASTGIVVVLLSALGGSLIVAEQLRGDQSRITELEDAVRTLTEALAPSIELPARRTPEAGHVAAFSVPDPFAAPDAEPAAPKVRGTRPRARTAAADRS
ncbi:MAG: hypothetical protein ABIO67_12600 [Mycobacteriales bacterium]